MYYASRLIAYLHKNYIGKRPTMQHVVEQDMKTPRIRPNIIDGKAIKYFEETLKDLRGVVSDNEAIRDSTQTDYNSIINVFQRWARQNGCPQAANKQSNRAKNRVRMKRFK